MKIFYRNASIPLIALAAWTTLPAATADELHVADRTQGLVEEVGEPTSFSTGTPIDSDRLAAQRGGADVVSNEQTLRGTVGSNIATDVMTGANSISAGSFANASGIPIVIQNSGANVLIQNATIINLQMQ